HAVSPAPRRRLDGRLSRSLEAAAHRRRDRRGERRGARRGRGARGGGGSGGLLRARRRAPLSGLGRSAHGRRLAARDLGRRRRDGLSPSSRKRGSLEISMEGRAQRTRWRLATLSALPLLVGGKSAGSTAFDDPAGTPPPARALVGGTLVDGAGGVPVADAVVVLRDGRIACAGARAACPVPADAGVVDARGTWITPGLID